jgi:hypothetical protein
MSEASKRMPALRLSRNPVKGRAAKQKHAKEKPEIELIAGREFGHPIGLVEMVLLRCKRPSPR